MPFRWLAAMARPEGGEVSFLSTDCDHVVVETVKTAENGDGLIVRLYEAHNRRGTVELRFCREIEHAEETDLLERPVAPVAARGNTIHISVLPFQVKTLRVRLR